MISQIVFYFGIFLIIIYIVSLLRVIIYERKINKLNRNKQKEIEDVKNRPGIGMNFLNGTIKRIEEKHLPKIEELERKRRFILEKLPFIKK